MQTEAQTRAKRNYLKKCKQVNIVIYPTERDIAERIGEQGDKTGYIKGLIRDDIARGQRYEVYHEQTDELTTGEVVRMATKILDALGETDRVPEVVEAQGIVARAMSARDAIIGAE